MLEITERVREWPRLEGINKLIKFTNNMQYHVWIEETVCGDVIVEANSEEEAKDKAINSRDIDWSDFTDLHVTDVHEHNAEEDEEGPADERQG